MSSHKFVVQTSIQIEEIDDDERSVEKRGRRRSSGDPQYTDIKSKYFARLNLKPPQAGKAAPASFSRVSHIVCSDINSSPRLSASVHAEVTQNFPRIASHSPSIAIPIMRGTQSASNSREPTPPFDAANMASRQANSVPTDTVLSPPRLRDPWPEDEASISHGGPFGLQEDTVDRVLAAIVRGDDLSFPPSNFNDAPVSHHGAPSNAISIAKPSPGSDRGNSDFFDDPFEPDVGGDYFEEEVHMQQQPRFNDYFRS